MDAQAYSQIALSVWASLTPPGEVHPEGEIIANAIGESVAAEKTPTLSSFQEDTDAVSIFVYYESLIQTHPKPMSWDAKAGISCGILQEPCKFVRVSTLKEQVDWWFDKFRLGRRICPQSPAAPLCGTCGGKALRMANSRMSQVRWILSHQSTPVAQEHWFVLGPWIEPI